ncbi:conserved hypothetical protein [Talaromyces stipitatus ATCC 10500]|uniref:Uncharacterized protein n=1 Tax=Talaromyces stipitatus (strain ATCC 10500 / CBS 375.48 / QM 6759 / NRRL 1006) TaxID=441959 RepID=B8LTE5_TALSN|nr:uncharacterized protein TSTA_064860 [Talaromyces stipitatus ATCC 10500]EED23023.1 conserved hypothetical protein [Talaromyces stipitatus ATCC 10500]
MKLEGEWKQLIWRGDSSVIGRDIQDSLVDTCLMIDARVLSITSVADFINFILDETNSLTTVVVCSTRERLLKQLTADISAQLQEHDDHQLSGNGPSPLLEAAPHPSPSKLSLLSNTIGAITISQRIKLVFCPSLAHLRAYLSTFQLHPSHKSIDNQKQAAERGRPVIAILDFLAIHYVSTQFSAQGLSQTLSLAVETAARTDSSILLCECDDAVNPGDRDHGQRLWDLHVPLLNGGSLRSDHERAGRHIPVRQVAQRWFRFE